MYVANTTDNYNDTISLNSNCTNSENDKEIIIPLTTKIPCALSLICLISPMIYTLIKPLFNKKKFCQIQLEKILYATHPVRCIITGPSECGKSVFLTNLILNIINEFDKIYIYSPSFSQDLYQKYLNVLVIKYPFT